MKFSNLDLDNLSYLKVLFFLFQFYNNLISSFQSIQTALKQYPNNQETKNSFLAKQKALNDFKKTHSQYLTNDSNFPNFEKLNINQRKQLMNALHNSRVNNNLRYNPSSKQDRINQYNDTVKNLLESKIAKAVRKELNRYI